MAGLAIITEACVDTKERAYGDVCPVQCIYEFNSSTNQLLWAAEAGSAAWSRPILGGAPFDGAWPRRHSASCGAVGDPCHHRASGRGADGAAPC